jgi:Asp-tRNA(Asn)/Glu-tRNA(Gln) amidotransferase A subunit family amidase
MSTGRAQLWTPDLGGRRGALTDWTTQRWVQLTGRAVLRSSGRTFGDPGFCFYVESEPGRGWARYLRTMRETIRVDRNPCGSSSGTGAAIAANFATVGVGTETDGSIVCPSAATSLVGIKATLGLVSRSGIIPVARSQDTAGPITRTVEDAAILLSVLAGSGARDMAATPGRPPQPPTDYRASLDANGLRGARIGVARTNFIGYAMGLPVGISLIGRAWSEALLIKLSYAFEQGTKHRRPPTFSRSANLNGSSR